MSRQSVIDEETCRRDQNPASDCSDVGVTTQCLLPRDRFGHTPGQLCESQPVTTPLRDGSADAEACADATRAQSNCADGAHTCSVKNPSSTAARPAASPLGKQQNESVSLRGRRNLLAGVAALALAPAINSAAAAASKIRKQIVYPERSLSLNNVHTGENERVVYWADGTYQTEGLNRINWILRDFRTSETKSIDPRLLNILYLLTRTLDVDKPVLVLSGYRSKKTNDMLRRTTEGVARRSFHMAGRAIDIRMPSVRTQHVQHAALQLGGGGVGYYPSSNFVHLDSGPVRTW